MKGAPMIELIYFILGITFAYVIEPLLEKIMALITTLLDVALGNCHITLTQQEKEIERILEEPNESPRPIGFALEEEKVEEDKSDEPEGG